MSRLPNALPTLYSGLAHSPFSILFRSRAQDLLVVVCGKHYCLRIRFVDRVKLVLYDGDRTVFTNLDAAFAPHAFFFFDYDGLPVLKFVDIYRTDIDAFPATNTVFANHFRSECHDLCFFESLFQASFAGR